MYPYMYYNYKYGASFNYLRPYALHARMPYTIPWQQHYTHSLTKTLHNVAIWKTYLKRKLKTKNSDWPYPRPYKINVSSNNYTCRASGCLESKVFSMQDSLRLAVHCTCRLLPHWEEVIEGKRLVTTRLMLPLHKWTQQTIRYVNVDFTRHKDVT